MASLYSQMTRKGPELKGKGHFSAAQTAKEAGLLRKISLILLATLGLQAIVVAQPAPPQENPADLFELDSDAGGGKSLTVDVQAYQQQIAELEVDQGAYSPALSESLLALGLALQRSGDHDLAVATFKRGVHLSRVNEGLYSSRQMALLQGEIASHVALGAYAEADERQRYLHRVQQRTLSDTTRGQALMQHAVWQRQAYEAGLGDEPFARLVHMWTLYLVAHKQLLNNEGPTSPLLRPALYGMLQSQYLVSGFVGETTSGHYRTRTAVRQEESLHLAYGPQSYRRGNAVIRALYDLETAQPGAGLQEKARIEIMLADWQLWHGKRSDAMETYALVYRELDGDAAAQDIREKLFAVPEPLPNLEGVRALPDKEDQPNGRLLLEFGVTERGRVVDLVRLDEYERNNARADDIMRRLRQTLFRPRFDDGMPVETEGLRWAYDTSKW